jgi:N6-adenosine-specific RNA methylase IME4
MPAGSYSGAEQDLPGPFVILSPIINIFSSVNDIGNCVVYNPSAKCTKLVVDQYTFQILPRCAFLLSDVNRPGTRISYPPNQPLPTLFDFILLDPPWSNRSVRRAKTYRTAENQSEDPFRCVLKMLPAQLKSNGLVGVWVTNKATIRLLVLDALHQHGFQLDQEWIWMKTTVQGEPVTPLDGLWRRPYEVLLLFRRKQRQQHLDATSPVPHRVFVSVPSHHSQKPCLKEFIEPLLDDGNDYQALEVFARNLTAGWFSWGNDVLKFNWEGYWALE